MSRLTLMRSVVLVGLTVAIGALAIQSAGAVTIPPPSEAWSFNKQYREDPRPLEITSMLGQEPWIDGQIDPGEWMGAVEYEVYGDPNASPGTMGMGMSFQLGTLSVGIYGGYLYVANDWTINDNPDPNMGGANAWRFGTSTAPGAGNSGTGNWFEIYVEDGDPDTAMARYAATEAGLDTASWGPASNFHIRAASGFNGQNWQYELALGGYLNNGVGEYSPSQPGPEPGPLPYCWHWEWQQIDPRPLDGVWIPVYDGSVHNNYPEPTTMILLGSGLLAVAARRRRKRA